MCRAKAILKRMFTDASAFAEMHAHLIQLSVRLEVQENRNRKLLDNQTLLAARIRVLERQIQRLEHEPLEYLINPRSFLGQSELPRCENQPKPLPRTAWKQDEE